MIADRRALRAPLLAGATMLSLVAATSASAVEKQTVERFVRLSSAFHAQLPKSRVARLAPGVQRDRAVCILTRFENAFGADGVRSLMGLMSVLSKGAEFDDATIVAFNERFGPRYDQIVKRCTRAAGS